MTDYIRMLTNPHYGFEKTDAERMIATLRNQATIAPDGVIRWNTNNTVPPDECLALAVHIGLPIDLPKCEAVRDAELRAFLDEYARRQPAQPSEEERAEARAAHGPGVTLVNVITGYKFTT